MKKLYFEGMMQMEERSLRITGADKTFFTKITNALTKMLIPTKIGINGMLISIKRNNLLKAFESYNAENENYNKDELEKTMLEKAGLWLDEGYIFGTGGEGFERFNLAIPRSVLEDACQRLLKAFGK